MPGFGIYEFNSRGTGRTVELLHVVMMLFVVASVYGGLSLPLLALAVG